MPVVLPMSLTAKRAIIRTQLHALLLATLTSDLSHAYEAAVGDSMASSGRNLGQALTRRPTPQAAEHL